MLNHSLYEDAISASELPKDWLEGCLDEEGKVVLISVVTKLRAARSKTSTIMHGNHATLQAVANTAKVNINVIRTTDGSCADPMM